MRSGHAARAQGVGGGASNIADVAMNTAAAGVDKRRTDGTIAASLMPRF